MLGESCESTPVKDALGRFGLCSADSSMLEDGSLSCCC